MLFMISKKHLPRQRGGEGEWSVGVMGKPPAAALYERRSPELSTCGGHRPPLRGHTPSLHHSIPPLQSSLVRFQVLRKFPRSWLLIGSSVA
jgi:hypothetical protein